MNRPRTVALIITLVLISLPISLLALNIDSTYKFAWGENVGWINFGTSEGDVDVSSSGMDGYAWGENVGWISLTCSNTASCGTVNYGITLTDVSAATKDASGYAWGENVGWISFACENTSSCATVDYGVSLDRGTGQFSGYAWGENVGWIVFNCSTTGSCATVDYKVATGVALTPTPGVPPGPLPTPTITTGPSVTPTATPTGTPTTSPTVVPTTSPTPLPSATPIKTPPFKTPTASPQPTPPGESPRPEPVEIIGRGIDTIGSFLFEVIPDACDDDWIQAGACGATAISLIVTLLGLLAMVLQQEIAAATFSLLQVVGLKKRAKVWGTVYDSQTKRPIPLAKTELLDAAGRVLETRYADRDGRYGFLLSPSVLHGGEQVQISIRVTKPGYQFPTQTPITGTDYFVYENVYVGGLITVRSDSVLTFNIPGDPKSDFRASFSGFGRSLTGPLVDRILNFGFYAGLVLVPLNLYLVPNTKNLIILIVFLISNLFRLLVRYRPYGTTVDAQTGQKLPFALVTLNEIDGRRATFAVSDEFGRYILSAEKDHEYELVAHTPANVSPQRETRERIRLKSGWMTRTIEVGKSQFQQPPAPAASPSSPAIARSIPPQSSAGPSGLTLSVLFLLFAVGFSAGRPRLPIGAVSEGIDEAYAVMHPHAAAVSDVLRENTPLIEILATVATATVLAGAVLAAREAFMNWLRGRRGSPPMWQQNVGTFAFLIGAIAVPMTYLFDPSAGRALLGILFLSASAVWARSWKQTTRS